MIVYLCQISAYESWALNIGISGLTMLFPLIVYQCMMSSQLTTGSKIAYALTWSLCEVFAPWIGYLIMAAQFHKYRCGFWQVGGWNNEGVFVCKWFPVWFEVCWGIGLFIFTLGMVVASCALFRFASFPGEVPPEYLGERQVSGPVSVVYVQQQQQQPLIAQQQQVVYQQ